MPRGIRLIAVHCFGPTLSEDKDRTAGVTYTTQEAPHAKVVVGVKIPRNCNIFPDGQDDAKMLIEIVRNDRDASFECTGRSIDQLILELSQQVTPQAQRRELASLLMYIRTFFSAVPAQSER